MMLALGLLQGHLSVSQQEIHIKVRVASQLGIAWRRMRRFTPLATPLSPL
jgi:hypothetical protein